MGNRFDAYLAGRVATEPTPGTTKDGKPWVRFRLAVDDRSPNPTTGEWETSQTIFHDVVAFGRLADRSVGVLHVGDAVIAHGEFRFRSYEDSMGTTRTGSQFVASRLGPDILLSDVTVHGGRDREGEANRTRDAGREATSTPGADAERVGEPSTARDDAGATTPPVRSRLTSRPGHNPVPPGRTTGEPSRTF
jgi:single-strand DNA-binding protein